MSDWSRFLKEQIQGEIVQADAEFSLDPKEAKKKLAPFQQAVSAYGLLRICQSLQAHGATTIDLEVQKRQIVCHAKGEFGDGLFEAAESTFKGANLFDDSPEANLAVGLHCLLLMKPNRLQLVHGDRKWHVHHDETPLTLPLGPGFQLHCTFPEGELIPRDTIVDELQKRCRFSPCPFTVNKEPLRPTTTPTLKRHQRSEGEYYLERVEPGETFAYDIVQFQHYDLRDGLFFLQSIPEDSEEFEKGPVVYSGLPADFSGKSIRCKAVVALSHGKSELNETPDGGLLVVLRHGVVAETVVVEGFLEESLVIADFSDIPCDLSGLRVIQEEAFHNRVEELKSLMIEVAHEAREKAKDATMAIVVAGTEHFKKKVGSGCLMKLLLALFAQGATATEMEKKLFDKALEQAEKEEQRLDKWLAQQKSST